MTAEQQESERKAPSPLPTLSRQCKHQLAMLIANLIEMHLSNQGGFDAEFDAEPADQVRSSNCLNPNKVSIKEDCHACHRSTFDQDQRGAPSKDRVRLFASIEHGTSS